MMVVIAYSDRIVWGLFVKCDDPAPNEFEKADSGRVGLALLGVGRGTRER
jgi:hypothetical protein